MQHDISLEYMLDHNISNNSIKYLEISRLKVLLIFQIEKKKKEWKLYLNRIRT